MPHINQIVKDTLINLNKKSIAATPNAYAKEFCNIAKQINFTTDDCDRFSDTINKLSKEEQKEIKDNNLETYEDIIPVLLQRTSRENIEKMAYLFNESLEPSISIHLNEDLHKFSVKIGNSPELIFENNIQEEIRKFIEKRINLDKNELEEKAKEISKVMTFMSKYFTEAMDSSSEGSSSILEITKGIETLDTSNKEDLDAMQNKLVDAAKSIEETMSKTTTKLKSGQNKVASLESKIISLEKELQQSRKESDIDHLTGLLTRRSYNRHVQKIDDKYNRNNVDYAIIFFDLDHFKAVNDNYGHDAGDVILTTFAKVLLKSTRDLDIVGRYGGEEFVAILHFDKHEELETYVKRVKKIVTSHKFKYNDLKIPITFSAGVTIRSKNKSYQESIQKADELLYSAKHTGRNKIIFHNGIEL